MKTFFTPYGFYVLLVCLVCAMANQRGWTLFGGARRIAPPGPGGGRSYVPHGTFHK